VAGVVIGLKFPEVKAEATEAMVAMKALVDEIVKGGRVRSVSHAAKRAHEKLSSMMKKAHKKECSGMTMKLLGDIAKTLCESPAMKEAIEKIPDYVQKHFIKLANVYPQHKESINHLYGTIQQTSLTPY